jgi:mRNA interferase MazF
MENKIDEYYKDFDQWNEDKKKTDQKRFRRYYKPREIWWCRLGVNVGYEQDGTGEEFDRPVLILRRFNKNVCFIAPLTTSPKENKYLIPVGKINNKEAQVIISQIRLIDVKRLVEKRTERLDKKLFKTIRKAIKKLF